MKSHFLRGCLLAILALAAPSMVQAVVWVVDDPADPIPVTGTLTLRQALTFANAMPGVQHRILFQIPAAGMQTIFVTSPLPVITVDSVWIDGYSQPGASPGASPPATATILVQLDGLMAGPSHGLWVQSSFNRIEGLAVMNFDWDGIRIQGTPLPGTRCNMVHGNFVGTDAIGGVAAGNGRKPGGNIWAGVDVLCTPGPLTYCWDNLVDGNLISTNFRCGVQISSCPPSDCWANQVLRNFIGTDVTGMNPFGNLGSGVVLAEGTHDNVLQSNVISDNGGNGVDITGNFFTVPPSYTYHNSITSNLIGVASDGITPMGNGGRGVSVGIFEASSFFAGFGRENLFTTNTVAHNFLAGFSVWEHPTSSNNADQNTYLQNDTHDNGGLGIDLGDNGVTVNDPGDMDAGANEELNGPLVMTAVYYAGTTTITGIVDNGAQVHVYRARLDPSGWGEGELWLSSAWPDPLGGWTVSVTGLVPGDFVTALAMDWAGGGVYSNTSEFAQCMVVQKAVGVGEVDGPRFVLRSGGPNPFRSATAFRYRLGEAGPVWLGVYDPTGRLVRTLASGYAGAGEHEARWDGAAADGRPAPTGIYFVGLSSGARQATVRILKVK
ncbi:MAG: right-handed parallel beta-helix repeat-containing protein [Candidatus Eisenbacteria bacterium]|nr:right-handed parallel beta-helix repeat-containing protein [Candidatus Eisenbacteria bacterium]